MTDREHLSWDAAEQALVSALNDLGVLFASVPDGMATIATRNRIRMAQASIEDAQDFLAAARARLTLQD
jgi:hypothetical protein